MLTIESITWGNVFIASIVGMMGWTVKSMLTLTKAQVEVQQWIKDREAVCAGHEKRIARAEDRLMQ